MSTKFFPINAVISVHVHSTESEEKVMTAIKNIFPQDIVFDSLNIKRERLSGHHGNSIIRLEIIVKGKKAISLFQHLISKLKGQIRHDWFSERFDSRNKKFYLRLDKQYAYLGNLKVGYGDDVIKIVFSFPGYVKINPSSFEEKMREIFEF